MFGGRFRFGLDARVIGGRGCTGTTTTTVLGTGIDNGM